MQTCPLEGGGILQAQCQMLDPRQLPALSRPAGHIEQGTVEGLVPVPGQPDFGKGRVEGRAMAIAFGIGEGSIDIENDRAQGHDESPQDWNGMQRLADFWPGRKTPGVFFSVPFASCFVGGR